MDLELKVGPVRYSDGQENAQARGDNFGGLLTGSMNGYFAEQVMRGNGYVFESALAGVALLAPTTTDNKMLIYNPSSSGRILILQKATFARTAKGTPLEGAIVYSRAQNILTASTAAGTGNDIVSYTPATPVNLRSDLGNNSGMIFAPLASVLTAAPTFWGTPGIGQTADNGATTVSGPRAEVMVDWIYGMMQLWPGSLMSVGSSVTISTTYKIAIYGLSLPLPAIS